MSLNDFIQTYEFVWWRDLLDIALVAWVIYQVFLLVRHTRAAHMFMGVVFLIAVYYFSDLAGFRALHRIASAMITYLPFAVIVIFQRTLRRAFINFGKNPLRFLFRPEEPEAVTDAIASGAFALARKRTGALIVLEREEGMRGYMEGGVPLDARISFHLLLSLFQPSSPLHDGAVVLQGDRVAAASCFLPLSTHPDLDAGTGSRRRAAVGVTEETDALAVVVSEEDGSVAVAEEGRLTPMRSPEELRDRLWKGLGGLRRD